MSPSTACSRRPLVQPVDRHHREQLLDRPAVRNRLEQREVAEVGGRQLLVEVLQVLGHFVHLLHELLHLRADRPEQVSACAALLERQVAAAEQVQRHVQRLLRVVIALERVARRQVVERVDQVDQRLLDLFAVRRWAAAVVAEARDAEHVEDQHRVIRDHGAAAFRHDRRVRHARIVAHALDVVDDVVGVFLERVVHARLEVGLRAVVVDAQAAADVEILAGRRRPCAARRRRAAASFSASLTTRMFGIWLPRWKWSSLKQSAMPRRFSSSRPVQDLADRQAELRAIAARALPPAAAACRQLHAHADLRPHADLLASTRGSARAPCISRRRE